MCDYKMQFLFSQVLKIYIDQISYFNFITIRRARINIRQK